MKAAECGVMRSRTRKILNGTGWIQKRPAQDIDNAGHKEVKVVIKSDQEVSMVALQHEVQRLREAKTIPANSPVGESECNGRVENTIGRVQDKMRTLKSHIEAEIGLEIDKMDDLMSWIIRWSGELITRYYVGKDRVACERISSKVCNKPMCQIGDVVLYMPLDSPATEDKKIETRMGKGIWLGMKARTEENLIGTCDGVVECRTVQRRPEGEQRNAAQLQEMQGTCLGINSDKIPTAISDKDKKPPKPKTYTKEIQRYVPSRPVTRMASAPGALKIFKRDVGKYDPTPGRRECTEITAGRGKHRHAITQNIPHSSDCRARMSELMRRDEVDRVRVEKAEGRQSKFEEEMNAKIENTNEEDNKEEKAEQEEETDVALYVGREANQSEFQAFLNNIHVSFAKAVEENYVREVYSVPRVLKDGQHYGPQSRVGHGHLHRRQ